MGLLGVPAMFQVVYHPPAGLSGQVFWVVVEVQVAHGLFSSSLRMVHSLCYQYSISQNKLQTKTNLRG